MKRIAILTALILAAVSAFGQAARVDIPLLTSGPSVPITGGALPQTLWVANSLVYVCTHPSATLAACQAAPVTTYTDSTEGTTCPSTTQMVQLPGNTCTASSGVTANVGFWYGGGLVDYWVVSPYGNYGPFTVNPPYPAVSDCPTTGCAFTGPVSVQNRRPGSGVTLDITGVKTGVSNISPLFGPLTATNINNPYLNRAWSFAAYDLTSASTPGSVASGTYISGITATGAAGTTCILSSFNNSSTATAVAILNATNSIYPYYPIVITQAGTGATAPPTSATATSGTATCSGTATITTVLGSAITNFYQSQTAIYHPPLVLVPNSTAGGTQFAVTTANPSINVAGPFTMILALTPSGTTGTILGVSDAMTYTNYQTVGYNGSGGATVGSYNGTTYNQGTLYIGTSPVLLLLQALPGGNVTLTRLDTGASVSVVNANPIGTAQIGIGVISSVGRIADSVRASYFWSASRILCCSPGRPDGQDELSKLTAYIRNYTSNEGLNIAPPMTTLPTPPSLAPSGLALTPPMGFNTWGYGAAISEAIVEARADFVKNSGLLAAGYKYQYIEEGLFTSRDANGNLLADATNFPSGAQALVNYIHNDGELFGTYTDPGSYTCLGKINNVLYPFPGMYQYEAIDSAFYAALGVDYVKVDDCSVDNAYYAQEVQFSGDKVYQSVYGYVGQELRASGRPMVTMTEAGVAGMAGASNVWVWGQGAGYDQFRIGYDTVNCWSCASGVLAILESAPAFAPYSGPGFWADPDMMMLNGGVLTSAQDQSWFAMWSMLSAPLNVKTLTTNLNPATVALLNNQYLIAIDQDALGKMALRVSSTACGSANCEVWAKQLTGTNRCAIAFLNQDTAPHSITASFAAIAAIVPACGTGPYTVTNDVWTGSSVGTLTTSYTSTSVAAGFTDVITVAP